jgi:NhaP-type Na+/H+ or K+/H+ antiporter
MVLVQMYVTLIFGVLGDGVGVSGSGGGGGGAVVMVAVAMVFVRLIVMAFVLRGNQTWLCVQSHPKWAESWFCTLCDIATFAWSQFEDSVA